jgi:hypothetical protein
MTGVCTDVRDDAQQKLFLGGTDLREQASGQTKLKSIDDFNKAQMAGGSDVAPVLDRLRAVLMELDMEGELFDQVVDGMKKQHPGRSEADVLAAVSTELGTKLKAMMKSIAAEQLRIK